jgi:hypothetical protein
VVAEEEPDGQIDAAKPTISLHAITGIQMCTRKTMQLMVAINDIKLCALLDSGLTHNFIDMDAVHHAGIAWKPTSGLQVAMANSDRLNSLDHCRDMRIIISPEPFVIDCYGLELASSEMVLGVQWFESLGPPLGFRSAYDDVHSQWASHFVDGGQDGPMAISWTTSCPSLM